MRTGRWVAWALTVPLLAGLVVFALAKVDLAAVGRALDEVHADWVALAFILMASSFLARGESWFATIRAALPDRRIGRVAVTRGLLIGMAGSSVAPGRLGEAARAWVIARRLGSERATLPTIAGTILAQTLLNLLALALLAIVAFSVHAIPGARSGAIIVALALPVVLVLILVAAPRLLRLACPDRVLGRWLLRAGAHVEAGRDGLRVFRGPRTGAHATSAQLAAWALQWLSAYAVIVAFGFQHHASLAAAAAVLVAVNLTAILPLTPSNVGVFQAACIAVLARFGIETSRALAYGLVLQAVEVASALGLGLPALACEGLTLGQLRAHAPAQPPTRIPHVDR